MDGVVDKMGESRYQWSSRNKPLFRTYDGGIPYSDHASQFEAQHADDCVGFSSASEWTEDRRLTHTQQGQHGELESHSSQRVLRETANYHAGSAHENAVFTIGRFNTAYGTTEDGCNLLIPAPNLPWCEEGNFPHQQLSSFYPCQQTQAGTGSSSHYQDWNGSSNDFITDPSVISNNEPWSTYNTLDCSQTIHHPRQMAAQNVSDAKYSTFAHDDPGSVHNCLETPVSNKVQERRSYSSQPSPLVSRINNPLSRTLAPASNISSPYNLGDHAGKVLSLNKTEWHSESYLSPQDRRLAPPRQRRVSSASSQTTEATSSSARSDHSLEVLTCPVASCRVAFFGKFRKGNQKRHMRTKHADQERIACNDCGKIFGRSDALLKHSRKQHPGRAAGIPLVSRSKRTGLRDEH